VVTGNSSYIVGNDFSAAAAAVSRVSVPRNLLRMEKEKPVIVWRNGKSLHVDHKNHDNIFYSTLYLPDPSVAGKTWCWHFTDNGLYVGLIETLDIIHCLVYKYNEIPDPPEDLATFIKQRWWDVAMLFPMRPKFYVANCIVVKLNPASASQQPKRQLHCQPLLSRELMYDGIVQTPKCIYQIEMRLKLRKVWMPDMIHSQWYHKRHHYDETPFLVRLRHH
jgi:hypothetical protein